MVLIYCKDVQDEKLNSLIDFDKFKEFAKAVIRRTNKDINKKNSATFSSQVYFSSIKNNIELMRFIDFMENDYIGQDFVIELKDFNLINDGIFNKFRYYITTYFLAIQE